MCYTCPCVYPFNFGSMNPVNKMYFFYFLTQSETSHKNFSSQSAPSHDLYSHLSHKYVHGRNPPAYQKKNRPEVIKLL